MKIRNPIFLPFALALTIYVALANHHGWSLWQSVASNTWQRFTPNTQHK
jgi:F0F1-type ATP synthase membrane subunit a